MVATLQASTHPNLSTDTLDTQWRRMQGRDGIREDFTGGAFSATLSTTAPTVTIASAGRSMLVDGNLLTFSADAVLDPRDVGVQPTTGQSRLDLVVARYDTTVAVLKDRGTLAIKPGTPAASPVRPVPTRTPNGVWEVAVCGYRMPAAGLLTERFSYRTWSGDVGYIEAAVRLEDISAPLGALVIRDDDAGAAWYRQLAAAGTPSWVRLGQAQRDVDRALARPVVRVASLADGTVNATGTVLGGSTFNVPVPASAQRVLVTLNVTGVGPRDGSINGLFRLVVNGAQLSPEARMWGGDRSCSIVGETVLPASGTVQVQTFARALAGTFTIDPATNLAYTLVFS